jgi:Zn-finger nucleic acid-binding protein
MILIACPTCDRQYDVSHVPLGARVRCQCDEVIEVGTQKSMQVRALHCSHCGGAVEAEEPNCRWCGAKLTEQDRLRSTLCPKCYTRIEDDARHCKGCGVAIAPQALTPLPEDDACPRCAGELMIRPLAITDVVECGGCGGLWLSAKVFEAVCRDAERKLDTFLLAKPTNAEPPPEPPGRKYIPCLACRELMLHRNFRYGARPSGIIVDYCRGHGVWLDKDELEHVVQHVQSQGGGPPANGPAGREGLAAFLEPPVDLERARRRGRVTAGSRARRGPAAPASNAWWVGEGVVEVLVALGAALFGTH